MNDLYQQLWSPQEYLSQYYSTDYITDDEKAIFKFIVGWLKQSQKTFNCSIDFGCGCTLHHVMPLLSYVKEIHMADYLPENLKEIRKWLDKEATAHSWDVYLHGVLEVEWGQQVSESEVKRLKQELSHKITKLKLGDIRLRHPLNDGSTYDLVTSFYCAEAVTSSRVEWQDLISNLCQLVATGGTLLLSAVRNCHFYKVMDKQFPVAYINENDFKPILIQNGFDPNQIEVEVVRIAEWAEQGFDGICIVKAEKLQ
ncbi:MAG: hypothetical protein Kow00121_47520 [Elainellaceae cyanobacterium]